MPRARWLDDAPPAWRERFAGSAAASPSHDPEVWRALATALPGMRIVFLALEDDGRLVGGVPVAVERRAGFEWLHALPMLLPAAPLAEPGREADVDAAAIAAVAALAREHRVLGGEWSWYRPGQPAPGARAFEPLGEARTLEAAVIPLAEGPEAVLGRMDRKSRQALRQSESLGLGFAEEPAALEAAYRMHLAQGRAWSGHRALPLELARRLLQPAHGAAPGRLFTLRDGRGLLSATLALDGPHETFLWWSGTRPEGRRVGAFPLLAWHVVRWAAARGRARVNLGASTGLGAVASFKQSFGAVTEPYAVAWLDARHARGAGRLVAALQRRARQGRPRGEAA